MLCNGSCNFLFNQQPFWLNKNKKQFLNSHKLKIKTAGYMVNLALQNKFEMINGMLIFNTVAL